MEGGNMNKGVIKQGNLNGKIIELNELNGVIFQQTMFDCQRVRI